MFKLYLRKKPAKKVFFISNYPLPPPPSPPLKTWLGGKRFSSNEEVIDAVNAYFADLEKSYVSEGMKKLEFRWTKCVALEGDYVKK